MEASHKESWKYIQRGKSSRNENHTAVHDTCLSGAVCAYTSAPMRHIYVQHLCCGSALLRPRAARTRTSSLLHQIAGLARRPTRLSNFGCRHGRKQDTHTVSCE